MRLCFNGADNLSDGIGLLVDELSVAVATENEADVIVSVAESDERVLSVSLDGKCASITYGDGKARFFRGLAMLVDWIKSGETKKACVERPLFKTNGTMVDMSRNAVMNLKTLKNYIRIIAKMGYNCIFLYTEDTYEVEGEPYFGYLP